MLVIDTKLAREQTHSSNNILNARPSSLAGTVEFVLRSELCLQPKPTEHSISSFRYQLRSLFGLLLVYTTHSTIRSVFSPKVVSGTWRTKVMSIMHRFQMSLLEQDFIVPLEDHKCLNSMHNLKSDSIDFSITQHHCYPQWSRYTAYEVTTTLQRKVGGEHVRHYSESSGSWE